MGESALHREAHPLNLTMSLEQRDRMNRGLSQTYSKPSSITHTPPLRDHPGYSTVRTGDAWRDVPKPPPPPMPVKGKGSGKGKKKGSGRY